MKPSVALPVNVVYDFAMRHVFYAAVLASLGVPALAGAQPAAPPPSPAATPLPATAPAPSQGEAAPVPAGWLVYKTVGFSIAHPPEFAVDAHHEYEGLGEGRAILGTAFKVPDSFTSGTNLSSDSYLSVEIFPQITCTPHAFLLNYKDQPPIKQNGREWLVAADDEGAAGNLYRETVYALAGSVPCIAVRYFIHSTEIGNYDPGTVQPFDITQLTKTFDKMRQSLQPEATPSNPG